MNGKVFLIGILIVIACWIGNIVYYVNQQLDKPIFFEHYYDIVQSDHTDVTLYYVTNKHNPTMINSIEVNGINFTPTSYFPHNESHNQPEQQFQHHTIMKVMIHIPKAIFDNQKNEEGIWAFSEAKVFPEIGDPFTVNVGNIVVIEEISLHDDLYETKTFLGERWESQFIAKESMKITNIVSAKNGLEKDLYIALGSNDIDFEGTHNEPNWFSHELKEKWEHIDRTPFHDNLLPLELSEEDRFTMYAQLNPNKKVFVRKYFRISGISASGRPFHSYIHFDPVRPEFTDQELKRLIREES
ncbi:hypothetical protein [Salirhabdus salicampi]|uniref:hypothetical protein n=1 Tax=Salirhabdus salicampi TaxID=476102 RepID=UPI0020C51FFD|nr:hypothetical protein [Salirhabdus salicampi]MCP8615815.1 hypothetical protein [Salirhabdus salicampi]